MTLNSFEKKLNYKFSNGALLKEALTHASMKGNKNNNNERLEFLGDRILGLVIAKTLYQKFPESSEGELASRHAYLVSREVLGEIAETLELADALYMARGERTAGGLRKKSLIANACEAVIAALFLDGGFEIAEGFILEKWSSHLASIDTLQRDSKSLLQEWAQGLKYPAPTYMLISRTGPDHDPLFEMSVSVNGWNSVLGKGASKQEAEQYAARTLLNQIRGIHD